MLVRESRVRPPALDSYTDTPLFNTKAVVRQTGVPAPTLRAWERRYGILAPRRGDNDYRLYSERDMAVVAWLRERVEAGLTISQAIALLRSLDSGRKRGRSRAPGGPSGADLAERDTAETSAGAAPWSGRSSLSELCEALVGQFRSLDEDGARRTIAQAFAISPVEDVCQALFAPALTRIGELWEDGGASVTVEHFASALVRGQLEALFRAAPARVSGPLALVGCAPGELHELGALTLALFLRRGGLRVVYLGQSVELESLMETAQAARAECVLLSAAQRAQAAALAEVGRRLDGLGWRPAFFFGGQAFMREPELVAGIAGEYLGGAASVAADEIRRRLAS